LFVSGEYLKLDDSFPSIVNKQNPFLFYGAKVIEGQGNMMVTSMGLNTTLGEMMSKASKRRLPVQLDKVGNQTEIAGLATSILILVVLFLRSKAGKKNEDSSVPEFKGEHKIMEVTELIKRIVWKPSGKISTLTTCLTTFLVGVVEGVPFFIRLAIYYWNKKIPSTKAVVLEQLTGVTMGSVKTICIDKTSWITMNPPEVDDCWIDETVTRENSAIRKQVKDAFCIGISTSSGNDQESLISWCASKFGKDYMESLEQSYTIIGMKELSPGDEGNGVLVRGKEGNETKKFLYWKGLAPKILTMCSRHYNSEGKLVDMDTEKRSAFEKIINDMQSKHLKTIALAYKTTDDETAEDDRLILIGLLGLKDKCWETIEAVEACRNAGVNIILVSEDSESVIEDIAQKYGILSGPGILEHGGETFRSFSDEERKDVVNEIRVMGNSLPSDKLLLVRCLKQQGHIVAFVGVRTDDAPSLKEADVGIVTGTGSSELVNGSSELIILDGNLGILVWILKQGRCIYGNIHKYIQVEVTITISGLLISTVTTIFFGYAPMTAIQMIWVNLVVAVLGGLALLTEPPSQKLMEKPPIRPTEPFITKDMWRNIIIQASYQVSILLAFQFKGRAILNINEEVSKAMIFSSFLLCQLSNQFSASEQKLKNLVKGDQQNLWFWVASVLTVVLQVVFIEISHHIFGFARLNGRQWGICFLIGALSCVTDGAVSITCGVIKVKLTRSSSLAGSEHPQSTSILELPLIAENSSPPAS
jgi:Ca2+-transporting ATPase